MCAERGFRRRGRGATRRRLGLVGGACLVLGSLAGPARADTVDTTVTTLLQGRTDPIDGQMHTVVPVYESLSVLATIKRPFTDGLRVVFSGWGAMVLDIPREQRWSGDIDLGYLEGNFLKQRVQVRLGRQFVVGGAARSAQVDGLSATVRIYRGLGLTGYGGAPVTPRFGTSRGDAIFGARLFYRHSINTEVGLSFNQIQSRGLIARQDLGVDARYAPYTSLTFTGYALVALREQRLAEADFSAQWQPHGMVLLSADYRRTAPDLFLPLNSVFSVFSQETRDEMGGSAFVRPHVRVRLSGDYRAVLNADGLGHNGGGKVNVAVGHRDTHTISGEVRVLRVSGKGYVQLRLYSLHHLTESIFGTLGLNTYLLDQPINGQGYSLTGTGTLAWELGKGFRLVATANADVTPFVERRVEFIVRLAYNATRRFREVHE